MQALMSASHSFRAVVLFFIIFSFVLLSSFDTVVIFILLLLIQYLILQGLSRPNFNQLSIVKITRQGLLTKRPLQRIDHSFAD